MVEEHGVLVLIVFDRALLTKSVAHALLPSYADEPITIKNLDTLHFTSKLPDATTLLNATQLNFNLSGNPEFEWMVDESAIKKILIGLPKSNFNAKMSDYKNIQRARANVVPFWSKNFPNKESSIKVVLEGPKV